MIEASHDGYAWLPGAPVHRRTVRITAASILVEDCVPGWRGTFQSRLRLTACGTARLAVTGSHAIRTAPGEVWYPEHGVAEPATVFEQEASAGEAIRWELRWTGT